MSKVKSTKTQQDLLRKLIAQEGGKATMYELGTTYYRLQEMIHDNLVVPKGREMSGERGQPKIIYGLTPAGRKRAKRLVAKG